MQLHSPSQSELWHQRRLFLRARLVLEQIGAPAKGWPAPGNGRPMIHPSHGVHVFVATKPVDFRKGQYGLAALVQSHLQKKPFDGAVYVFRAKRADRLKMIWWDGTGLVMAYKRLEQIAFKWPAIRDGVLRLDPAQFEALFAGLDWRRVTALETRPPAAAE